MQKLAEKNYSGSDLINIPSCSTRGARSYSWKQKSITAQILQFPLGK